MSREKQIESERYEIAEIIAQNYRLNDEQYDASDFEWSAYCVQQAGYRKASEVAREIADGIINEILPKHLHGHNEKALELSVAVSNFITNYKEYVK
jgi:hypothetical protein